MQKNDLSPAEADQTMVLPYSVEAEQAVLGGLMLDNKRFGAVADVLEEEDFFKNHHRLIYRMIAALAGDGLPFDVATLAEKLDSHEELEQVGGMDYLIELAGNTISVVNIVSYAKIVREHPTVRQFILTASQMNPTSSDATDPGSDNMRRLAKRLVTENMPKEE